MNIAKRLSQRKNNRLPMNGKVKKGFRTYCMIVIATVLAVCCFTVTAFAAEESGGNAITFQPLSSDLSEQSDLSSQASALCRLVCR